MADLADLPATAPDAPARAGGAASGSGSGSGGTTDRFLLELEFVQALANPSYLNCAPRDPGAPGAGAAPS